MKNLLILTMLFVLTVVGFAQAAPKEDPAKGAPAPIALTKDETDAFDKIEAEIQATGKKLQAAVAAFVAADDSEDAFIANAAKLQLNLRAQNKLAQQQQTWLKRVRDAHGCADCGLSQDLKSLVKPPPAEKK